MGRTVTLRAWCFVDGVVHFSNATPPGALPIKAFTGKPRDAKTWRGELEGFCRLGPDNVTRYVPGVAESADQLEAVDALTDFALRLLKAGL
jgi:hypothetical protein